jgi:hypothetical protein
MTSHFLCLSTLALANNDHPKNSQILPSKHGNFLIGRSIFWSSSSVPRCLFVVVGVDWRAPSLLVVAIGARCRFWRPYPLENVRGKGQSGSSSLCVPFAGRSSEVTRQKTEHLHFLFACFSMVIPGQFLNVKWGLILWNCTSI